MAAGGAPKEILADPRVQAVKERESKAKEQEGVKLQEKSWQRPMRERCAVLPGFKMHTIEQDG